MLELQVDARGLEAVALELAATPAQAAAALRSTVGKMAGWVRTRSVKGLSAELQLQQRIIRRRLKSMRVRSGPDGASVDVWYGLDPVALIYLGARKTREGVTAGARSVPGGFIARARGGGRQVFKRRGPARLPLQKQAAAVAPQAESFIEQRIVEAAAFEAQFLKTFEHELQWRMQPQR